MEAFIKDVLIPPFPYKPTGKDKRMRPFKTMELTIVLEQIRSNSLFLVQTESVVHSRGYANSRPYSRSFDIIPEEMDQGLRFTRAVFATRICGNVSSYSISIGKQLTTSCQPSENFQLRRDIETPFMLPNFIGTRTNINNTGIGAFNRELTICSVTPNRLIRRSSRNINRDTQNFPNSLVREAGMEHSSIPLIVFPEVLHKKTFIHHRFINSMVIQKATTRPIIKSKKSRATISISPTYTLSQNRGTITNTSPSR